jgi:hypothetical protein
LTPLFFNETHRSSALSVAKLCVGHPFGPTIDAVEDYDVFISYRRDQGAETARLLRIALSERGYRVFLDVDDLASGHFDDRLLTHIENTPHFILILSPRALDGVSDQGDWLRREIDHALATGRNIIPLLMPGFDFSNTGGLPDSLQSLSRHNGVAYSHEYFDATVARLVRYMPRPEGAAKSGVGTASAAQKEPAATNSPSAPASSATYGAFMPEPMTPYLVFGLLTAWAYVARHLGQCLVRHLSARKEFFAHYAESSGVPGGQSDDDAFQDLSARAFSVGSIWPGRFAVGLAAAGLYVVGLFVYLVKVRQAPLQELWPVVLIAVGSAVFYLLVSAFVLWFRSVLYRHDRYESLLVRWLGDPRVNAETLPDGEFVQRWERFDQHLALFVIVGLPIIFSPAYAAWHVLYKMTVPLGVFAIPVAVFFLAAFYHLWGIRLLLGMYHDHLATEQQQRDSARTIDFSRQ